MAVQSPSKDPSLEDTLDAPSDRKLAEQLAAELRRIQDAQADPQKGKEAYQRRLAQEKERVRVQVQELQRSSLEGKSAQEQRRILSDPQFSEALEEQQRTLDALEQESFKLEKNPHAFFDEREQHLQEQIRRYEAQQHFDALGRDVKERYPGIDARPQTSFEKLYDPTQYLSPDLRKEADEERKLLQSLHERKAELDDLVRLREHPDPVLQKQAADQLEKDRRLRDLMHFRDRQDLERAAQQLQQAERAGRPLDQKAVDDFYQKQDDLLRRYPELRKNEDDNPLTFARPVEEHRDSFGGRVILHATDIHDNVRGIEALCKRALELKSQGKLSSIVLGGDLVRGAFDDKEDLIEYQKLLGEFNKLQHQLGGVMLHPISYLHLAHDDAERRRIKQGTPEEFQQQLDHALERYVQLYEKGKVRMKRTMGEMLDVARRYGVDEYLMVIPGNYEGTELLEDVFDKDGKHRTMGFKNIVEHHHQRREEGLEQKDRFRPRVIDRGGLRFFGYGGALQRTDSWIPKELQEYYPDLDESQFDQIRMLALSSVLQPIIGDLPAHVRTEIMEGRFTPFDLQRLERELAGLAKQDGKYHDERFMHLESQFKRQFDLIITEFQPDAKFLRRKMEEAKADVHVAHHPLGSDMSYFDDAGANDGGIVAYQTIKSAPSYKLGLYGHSHRTNLDVVEKDDGSYFFGIQTKGLNYEERNTDAKFGLASAPVSAYQRGEFAEVGLDDNKELAYVTLHQTMGNELLKDQSRSYTREELIRQKMQPKEGRERMESFDHFDYRQSSEYLDLASKG